MEDGTTKIKQVTSETMKTFKVYIVALVVIYVASSILASQHIIKVDSNQVLITSAVVVGVLVIGYQGYLTYKVRKHKKIEKQSS